MDRRKFITLGSLSVAAIAFSHQHVYGIFMKTTGIITRQSPLPVKETMDKLEAALKQKGITIYTRIDQQSEAAKAGIKLNGIEFLLFGNPKIGGLLMAEDPEAALDLPLKVLVWEDEQHTTHVSYNSSEQIRQRFSLNAENAKLTDIDPLITTLLSN